MFIDNIHFQAGHTAAIEGLPQTANPFLHKAQPFALWECGHTLATLLSNQDALNAEPLERADKEPFDQGGAAFLKGVERNDNPYGLGDRFGNEEEKATYRAHYDWLKGWTHARNTFPINRCVPTDHSKGESQDHVEDALKYASPGLFTQRVGRAYRGISPRMVPLINQDGKQVGTSRIEIDKVDCYTDEQGTAWVPPTAWAYFAVCKSLKLAQEEAAKAVARTDELQRVVDREVERRRAAERRLGAIAEAIVGVSAESDPNRV